MAFPPKPDDIGKDILVDFLERLQHLFTDMDLEYTRAIQYYGFNCDGCEQNCCRTRFYHHTYLEYLLVRAGLEELDPQKRRRIQSAAGDVCLEISWADKKGESVHLWCPLNYDERCTLYAFRPMICRLHGIPHELRKPAQNIVYGSGCETFDERCAEKSYFKFDRTPFYFAMAKLEREFKEATGLTGRVKMTIAEMILSMGHRA